MAYDTNSLNLHSPRMGAAEGGSNAGEGAAWWLYRSADAIMTVLGPAYIDDGFDKGMQVNDVVIVIDDATPTIDLCLVTVVDTSSNPAGDVTLINGT